MIELKQMTMKNILSYGNNVSIIDFETRSLGDVIGIIGRNGRGKTAIFDALFFVLFDQPFRDINKTDLLNRDNRSNLEVSITFISNNIKYKIERGMSPNYIRIYTNDIPDKLQGHAKNIQSRIENQILGISPEIFRQIFMIGLGVFKSFFRASISEKREILEYIVGMNVLSVMLKKNKLELTTKKTELERIKTKFDEQLRTKEALDKKIVDISNIEDSIDYTADIEKLKVQIKDIEDQIIKLDIDTINSKNKKIEKDIDTYNSELVTLSGEAKTFEFQNKQLNDLIKFMYKNDVCPTCTQPITIEFKENKIKSDGELVEQNSKKITELSDKKAEVDEKLKKIKLDKKTLESSIKTFNENKTLKTQIEKQIIEYDKKQTKVAVDTSVIIAQTKEELKLVKKELKELTESGRIVLAEIKMLDLYSFALKDTGIKKFTYDIILSKLNLNTNHHLANFNSNIKFHLDGELGASFYYKKGEFIKYASFSNGEKLIIDFSFMFGLLNFLEEFYGFESNFLFFDEILDTSLDDINKAFLIENIKKCKKNVIIISHDYNLKSSFDKCYEIVKENDFSFVNEI